MLIDQEYDARGLQCPLPVLKARKLLSRMAPGACLRIATDDPMAVIDLPHFCHSAGHRLVSEERDGSGTVFVIECGSADHHP